MESCTVAGNKDVDGGCKMMMPASAFCICLWALIMATVLAPIGFRRVSLYASLGTSSNLTRASLRASLQMINARIAKGKALMKAQRAARA